MLSLSNLPAFLSPFPLPSHLSTVLQQLIASHDPTLLSLILQLQHRTLTLHSFHLSLHTHLTSHLSPSPSSLFPPSHHPLLDAAIAAERHHRSLASSLSLTYGSTPLPTLACILARHTALHGGETFADLGSGEGHGVIAAHLCHSFSAVIGVELLRCLHTAAVELVARLPRTPTPPIRLVCADLRECEEWLDADIVFVNSTCFERGLMAELSERCERLKLGSRVLTLTHPLTSTHFQVQQVGSYPFSWGEAEVWVHTKTHPRSDPP